MAASTIICLQSLLYKNCVDFNHKWSSNISWERGIKCTVVVQEVMDTLYDFDEMEEDYNYLESNKCCFC